MIQETESSLEAAPNIDKKSSLLPVLICSGLSVLLANSGFLSFFFIAPLGYAALVYNNAWLVFALSSVMNIVVALAIGSAAQTSVSMYILYFTTLSLGFCFLMDSGRFAKIRTLYRFIIVSITASIVFLLVVFNSKDDTISFIKLQAQLLSSILTSESSDAVSQSAEFLIDLIKIIILRGGALVSAFFLYFANMRISAFAARVIKKQRRGFSLKNFFAPAQAVWVLSTALAMLLISSLSKLQTLELLCWNVLVICAIIFLAQGAGILSVMLSRRGDTFRLIANVVIFVAVLSPGINTVILGAVILLGITENWVPFRQPKKDGQASTPRL